jgi:hypothetical protein
MGLTDSLEALVAEHDRIGSSLRSRLGPGRPAADVEAALREVGLTSSDEIVELFGWHEIRDEPSDRSRIEWFWPASPLRLDEAVRQYRMVCSIGEGALSLAQFDEAVRTHDPRGSFTGFWREDWLPLLYGGEHYAGECGIGAGSERPPVSPMWRVEFHPGDDFPTRKLEPSLTAFVDRVVELFRLGGYEWNAEYQSIEPISGVFERVGIDKNVRPWPGLPPPP